MEKRRAISPLFHNIFNMHLTSGVKIYIHLLNMVVRFIVFLTPAIFRGTDISKCFRESIGIRDNESRLYLRVYLKKHMKRVILTGLTNTEKALEYARSNMFTTAHGDRSDAMNYVIVLTDGSSSDFNRTLQQASLLKQQNIAVIAIGIGTSINKPELNGIASDSKHVFAVSSFDALKTIRTEIKAAACEGTVIILETGHSISDDIAFAPSEESDKPAHSISSVLLDTHWMIDHPQRAMQILI